MSKILIYLATPLLSRVIEIQLSFVYDCGKDRKYRTRDTRVRRAYFLLSFLVLRKAFEDNALCYRGIEQ